MQPWPGPLCAPRGRSVSGPICRLAFAWDKVPALPPPHPALWAFVLSCLSGYFCPGFSPCSSAVTPSRQGRFHWHFHLTCICGSCRYVTGHIWACPPSEGDDYIFHCHPPDQKIPKPKRLQEWYKKMLDKAFAERIIHDYKVLGAEGRCGGFCHN